ncbi:hypothetical protein BC834DRAFT_908006 [Gloeopeniophorella convolvens]|nr:hypothetical protein BC834DRAFT_908006 [Gloeopeniophorella convolvens]
MHSISCRHVDRLSVLPGPSRASPTPDPAAYPRPRKLSSSARTRIPGVSSYVGRGGCNADSGAEQARLAKLNSLL